MSCPSCDKEDGQVPKFYSPRNNSIKYQCQYCMRSYESKPKQSQQNNDSVGIDEK